MLSQISLSTSRQLRGAVSGASCWRKLSADASAAVAKKEAEPLADDAPVGKFYNDLLHRGRGANRLALGDLRKLLQKCKEPDHLKYAVKAVHYYQRKGQDFSVEVNSHFVKVCVDLSSPASAAAEFAKPSSRIGAWTSATAFQNLTQGFEKAGDVKPMIDVLHLLTSKGVKPLKESIEVIIKEAAGAGDAVQYAKAVEGASKSLGDAEAQILSKAHPLVEAAAAPEPEPTAAASDATAAADTASDAAPASADATTAK